MKVVQLDEQTQKQYSTPSHAPKIVRWGPKKFKMTPKLSQNQKSKSKNSQKKKMFDYMSTTRNIF